MRRRREQSRPGVAYVLAMLYLLLFSVLAVGFYAASAMSMRIARNDRAAADAQAAAESGLEVLRHQIEQVRLPADVTSREIGQAVARAIGVGEGAMQHSELGETTFNAPSPDGWSSVDANFGTRYRAEVTVSPHEVWLDVIGRGQDEAITRRIRLRFVPALAKDESAHRLLADVGSYEEVSP